MNVISDIQSVSVFKRDASKILKQLKKTKQPVILTVNGKADAVIMDAESYQNLVEAKEYAETVAVLKLVIDRYRIIFTIHEDTVKILYVRGSYVGDFEDLDDE